jgi:cell division protein ZapA (FtsZ GTPase activity inhibitor)
MDNNSSVKVTIAGRTYPLTVKKSEAALVQEAAMLVNSNLKEYEKEYMVRDKQDLLAMCALQLADSNLKLQHKSNSVQEGIAEELVEMEEFVSGYLKKS